MMPVNSKSLFATLCSTIDKLERKEIDLSEADRIIKACSVCNNYLMYELKRSIIMANPLTAQLHRNIEIKNFDSIPENIPVKPKE